MTELILVLFSTIILYTYWRNSYRSNLIFEFKNKLRQLKYDLKELEIQKKVSKNNNAYQYLQHGISAISKDLGTLNLYSLCLFYFIGKKKKQNISEYNKLQSKILKNQHLLDINEKVNGVLFNFLLKNHFLLYLILKTSLYTYLRSIHIVNSTKNALKMSTKLSNVSNMVSC